jgi:hypothetical protein
MHIPEERQDSYPNSYLKEVRQDMEELRLKLIKCQNERRARPTSINGPGNLPGGTFSTEQT